MKHSILFSAVVWSSLVSAASPCLSGHSINVALDPPKPFIQHFQNVAAYRAEEITIAHAIGETMVFEEGSDYTSKKMIRHWTPSAKHKRAELLLTGMLFGECRGQDLKCAYAAGHVALNRAALNLDHLYGTGLWGVLNKHAAFSCLLKSDPNYKKIHLAMDGKLNPHSPDGIKWTMLLGVSHTLMHHAPADQTHGSQLYVAASMKHKPAWTHGQCVRQEASIGGHVFYRQFPTKIIHTGFLHLGKAKVICDYASNKA